MNRWYYVRWDDVLGVHVAELECPVCHLRNGWHRNHCQDPRSPDYRDPAFSGAQ